jgi:hypothetical protein
MDLDKHKLWLILGITFAVVILAFLVLYSPLTANFAGEASKIIDSKEINTDTGIKVPSTGTTDIATGKTDGDSCTIGSECLSGVCDSPDGTKNLICVSATIASTDTNIPLPTTSKADGDSCTIGSECLSGMCDSPDGTKNLICVSAPTATTGKIDGDSCTRGSDCLSGICDSPDGTKNLICVSATTATTGSNSDPEATLVSCADSDGDNPRVGGFVIRTINGQVEDPLYDQCYEERRQYNEYYCEGNEVRVHFYDCLSCSALQKTGIPYCSQLVGETGKEIDESTETTTTAEISPPDTIKTPEATLPDNTQSIPGDVDEDGEVNMNDVICLARIVLGFPEYAIGYCG